MVDIQDLKSWDRKVVRVRVSPWACGPERSELSDILDQTALSEALGHRFGVLPEEGQNRPRAIGGSVDRRLLAPEDLDWCSIAMVDYCNRPLRFKNF